MTPNTFGRYTIKITASQAMTALDAMESLDASEMTIGQVMEANGLHAQLTQVVEAEIKLKETK